MATEQRLIDAHTLELDMRAFADKIAYHGCMEIAQGVVNAIGIVHAAPTVDAVEVVRCKDCKHWHEETGWCNQHSCFIEEDGEPCHPWESNNWKMLSADDFCSYGERRSDHV